MIMHERFIMYDDPAMSISSNQEQHILHTSARITNAIKEVGNQLRPMTNRYNNGIISEQKYLEAQKIAIMQLGERLDYIRESITDYSYQHSYNYILEKTDEERKCQKYEYENKIISDQIQNNGYYIMEYSEENCKFEYLNEMSNIFLDNSEVFAEMPTKIIPSPVDETKIRVVDKNSPDKYKSQDMTQEEYKIKSEDMKQEIINANITTRDDIKVTSVHQHAINSMIARNISTHTVMSLLKHKTSVTANNFNNKAYIDRGIEVVVTPVGLLFGVTDRR